MGATDWLGPQPGPSAGRRSRLKALGVDVLFAYSRRRLRGEALVVLARAHVASASCADAGCHTLGPRPDDSCAAVIAGACPPPAVAGCWAPWQVPATGCGAAT